MCFSNVINKKGVTGWLKVKPLESNEFEIDLIYGRRDNINEKTSKSRVLQDPNHAKKTLIYGFYPAVRQVQLPGKDRTFPILPNKPQPYRRTKVKYGLKVAI